MTGGGLKVGDVYVVVSAAMGDFAKTMANALKTVEQTAKKMKEAAKGVAEVGAIFAAGMAAAVLASAQSNAQVQAELDRLKAYLYTLAADIGDAFEPYLKALTDTIASLVGAFQLLSPEVKRAGAEFVVFMASAGGVGFVVMKVAALVEGLAKALGIVLVPALNLARAAFVAFTTSFGGLLVPVLAIAAAFAVVVLAAGAVYEAWNDSSTGMRDAVLSAWESIKDLGAKLADTLSGWWATLKGFFLAGARGLLDVVAGIVKKMAGVLAPLARGVGLNKLAALYEDLQQVTGEKLLAGLQDGASFLADKAAIAGTFIKEAAIQTGKDIANGVAYGVKGLKRAVKDSGLDAIGDKISGLLSGGAGRIREPRGREVDVSMVGNGGPMRAFTPSAGGGGSTDVFGKVRTAAQLEASRMAAGVKDATSAFLGRLQNALPPAVQSFIEGFSKGGLEGGIIEGVGTLLMQSEGFADLMTMVASILQTVADSLGRLFLGLQPVIAAVSTIIDAGLDVLGPIFEMLGNLIAPLAPPLMVVGMLFQALAPIISMVIQVMMLIANPLMMLGGPVMKALFDVLVFVAKVIIRVVRAIAGVWNGIVGAVQSVLRTLADISILGAKPLAFLDGWADGLDKARINTDTLTESLVALEGLTWDSAKAKAEEIAETLKNKDALQKVNEQLSNVPRGFKVALERFRAQDAITGMPPTGRAPTPATPSAPDWGAPSGQRGPPPPGVAGGLPSGISVGNITITGMDPEKAMVKLGRLLENLGFRWVGTREGTP